MIVGNDKGETVGWSSKKIQAPAGAAEKPTKISFAPTGAFSICTLIPTVSPWATGLRASGAETAYQF